MRRLLARTSSRRYHVLVGSGILAALGAEVAAGALDRRAIVCCDDNVAPLYLDTVCASLRDAGLEASRLVIPAGEREKSLSRAEELYGVLYDRGLRRDDLVVALGGGVIGDLVGFVAATYQRGLGLVQVPTTLLAQVDAAIGGKTGVHFRAGKNYVGSFYQPQLVLADLATLATLSPREMRSGAAEVAKYGFIEGAPLLAQVERFAAAGATAGAVRPALIAACARAKLRVVRADEREESGARAVLNFGHTIAHAVEAATGFARYTHGEAVGLGLRAGLWLSQRLCGLPAPEAARGIALVDGLGLPRTLAGASAEAVTELVARDKKASAEGVGYVLLESFGRPRLGVTVPGALEREAVEWLASR